MFRLSSKKISHVTSSRPKFIVLKNTIFRLIVDNNTKGRKFIMLCLLMLKLLTVKKENEVALLRAEMRMVRWICDIEVKIELLVKS